MKGLPASRERVFVDAVDVWYNTDQGEESGLTLRDDLNYTVRELLYTHRPNSKLRMGLDGTLNDDSYTPHI